jgi:hypothetical protein
VGEYTRDEIEQAFQHFQDASERSAKSGDWREWSECFTEDARYYEHHYGHFEGRAQIFDWIMKTMHEPINEDMRAFPVEWYVIDEKRGWVICSVLNRMDDPGDGSLHEEANWTKLHYAGNGLFDYEEDMYNPNDFGEMIKGWLHAKKTATAKK